MKPSFSLPAILKITSAKPGLSCQTKSNVFRGQNSLSSAWVSAGVIYWDAGGTVGHNLCEKPMSSPADKDELKYIWLITTRRTTQPLIKDIWSVPTEERGNQPRQPRCSFPLFEESQNTHCKAAFVCISSNPELQIFNTLLGLDYGLKKKKDTIFLFLASRSRWSWSVDIYFSKVEPTSVSSSHRVQVTHQRCLAYVDSCS